MVFDGLTEENENVTTQLLANLMQRKYIRDAIVRYLTSPSDGRDVGISKTDLDSIKNESISTQVRTSTQGQPDLVVHSEKVFLVLENKIHANTTLQDHEVYDYIGLVRQHPQKNKYLVFLVPKNYSYLYNIRAINGEPDVSVVIHFWDDFIDYMESLEIESPVLFEAIDFFKKVYCTKKTIVFTAKEAVAMVKTDDYFVFRSFQKKFTEKIQDVKTLVLDSLNGMNLGSFIPGHTQDNEFALGEYIIWGKEGSIFFGLNNPKDFEDKKNAYSVCFWTKVFNCEYLSEYPFVKDEKWGWRCVPLFDENYSEIDFLERNSNKQMASRIVEIIARVCKEMKQ